MVQVKADGVMSAIFAPLGESAEVLDGEGKLLGFFIPASEDIELLRRQAFADHQSGAYQRRREASESDERFTTAQVLERLRTLETP